MAPNKNADKLKELWSVVYEEKPLEMEARLRTEEADAAHRRQIEWLLYRAVLGVLGVAGFACLIAMFLPVVPEESRKTAAQIVSTIVTGMVGFAVGTIARKEK